ncbi:MAG: hypothetical protein PWR08_1548 [Thermoanaerobacterium sp.]|nr:hypothetical protein [Thermoanaerobacterium sp.]
MSYEAYNAYLSVTKSTPSDIYKDEFQELVNAEYENTTTLKTVLHNGNSITVRVVGKFNAETLSRQNENYQKIIFRTPDYVVHVGDIFEFDNAKWICTDISSTVVSKSCTVTKANNEIKVYKNSILYKVPCIVEDAIRLYNMGIDENKYIIQPSTDIIIRVPNNEVTVLIKRDEVYKIGLSNYKVVDVSDIINPGLLILKCTWSAEDQHLPNYSINILNGDNVQVNISDSLQIQCEVLDGDIVLSPTPPLVFSSSDETIATIDNNGVVSILGMGIVTFTVSLKSDINIKDNITVEFVDVLQHNYVVTISGNTSIVKGKTATYTATFTDNGQVITETSEFWLTADDGVSTTTLATITSQDPVANTCVVTAGNTLGYVKLWCKNTAGNIVSEPFRIQIKNLF